MTIIASVIIFGLLVIAHEFGHFTVAKLSGITVEEFAIGMGPKVFWSKRNNTIYSVRIFPIGGFVKMLGEDEKVEAEGSFQSQPLMNRIATIAAGPVMNFILAIVLFSIIFFVIGTPTTIINSTTPGFPADRAGIVPGDRITEINGNSIKTWEDISNILKTSEKDINEIKVDRNGRIITFAVGTEVDQETGKRIIGITPASKRNIVASITSGIKHSYRIVSVMLSYLTGLIRGEASAEDIVGPVGIIHLVNQAAKTGIINLLSLAGLLSINLGIINLVPIPALDGSRIVFLVLEGIRRKPIDVEKESLIHFVGFVLLILLMILVAYRDILRFNLFGSGG